MFHAEFLIDDKDVVKLHYHLASMKVYNVEIKPAVNTKKIKGGVIEEVAGGAIKDRLSMKIIADYKAGSSISSSDINNLVTELGGSPTSSYISNLVDAKIIKRKGRGTFVVNSKKGG